MFTHLMIAMVISSSPDLPPKPVTIAHTRTATECLTGARARMRADAGRTYQAVWCVSLDSVSERSSAAMMSMEAALR